MIGKAKGPAPTLAFATRPTPPPHHEGGQPANPAAVLGVGDVLDVAGLGLAGASVGLLDAPAQAPEHASEGRREHAFCSVRAESYYVFNAKRDDAARFLLSRPV